MLIQLVLSNQMPDVLALFHAAKVCQALDVVRHGFGHADRQRGNDCEFFAHELDLGGGFDAGQHTVDAISDSGEVADVEVMHSSHRLVSQLGPEGAPVRPKLLPGHLPVRFQLHQNTSFHVQRLAAVHYVLQMPLGGAAPLGEFVSRFGGHWG